MKHLTFLMTSTFYPAYGVGGDALHVKWLAENLVSVGHEVHVLYSEDAHGVQGKGRPVESDFNGVQVHSLKTMSNKSVYSSYIIGNDSSVTKKFDELLRETKPDVVHHHNISLLGYGILRKRRNYLNLYTAHDFWLLCQGNKLLKNDLVVCKKASCFACALSYGKPPQIWRYSRGFRKAINEIDMFISPNDYLRKRFAFSFSIKNMTLPNFVPIPSNVVGISVFSNFFLYAGVLESYKGVMELMKAWKKITYESDAKLVIVGHGSLIDKITEFIRINGLKDKVILLGG